MSQPKILVVEDEAIVAMDLSQRLTLMDYEVTATVSTGRAAINQCTINKPDLILMDIQIKGDIDGIETATQIQEQFGAPIIFLTANSDIATVDRAKETGPLAYLLKPFEDRDLRTTIEIALHRHKLECELKRNEQALRDSERRYRDLFEHSNDAVILHDLQGRILDVNERTCELLGYEKEHLLSLEVTSLRPNGWQPPGRNPLQVAREKGQYRFESLFEKTDGEVLDVDISARIVDREKGIIQGVIRDITERKRAAEELEKHRDHLDALVKERTSELSQVNETLSLETQKRLKLQELESRAQRLEMAGTIAGQVAHDFNNLLAPIMAYPELIRDELPSDHPAQTYLDDIELAAKKISTINQDLLTLGRRGHYNQEAMNLNRVVLHAVKEMEYRTSTVTCELDLSEDLMNIKGGEAQIHRMLTNLLVNAQDAMLDIGQVFVKTENYYADDTLIAYGQVPRGEYVKLTITDTGCGIPDNIIQVILDPFFSTKTTNKKRGSGLGMSVIDTVIKDHNGYLDLITKVGHGTSFYIYLPVTREESEEDESEYQACGTEKILIVDDDATQRKVSSQLLTTLGYKACAVGSGERAIKFLKENPQDLVILDMVMPGGIDGTETYRRILEINPHQRAIILSGFSESDRIREAKTLGAGSFVKKPVTRRTIGAAIRAELDRPVEASIS